MTTSTVTWIKPEVEMPEIPHRCMTTEELFLVKVDGVTKVAHLYSGRPDPERLSNGWDFSEEAQSERHWLDATIRTWSERVIEAPVTEWARLPQ